MSFKKAYYYLFYKIYKFNEKDNYEWTREWKTGLFIDVFVMLIFFSGFIYYTIYGDRYFDLSNSYLAVRYILIIVLPNYFIFHHQDRWKVIVDDFDKLPQLKNRIGSWVVFAVVAVVIANLFYAFYLMSQIDWSLYR